jgi:hypothetical protein
LLRKPTAFITGQEFRDKAAHSAGPETPMPVVGWHDCFASLAMTDASMNLFHPIFLKLRIADTANKRMDFFCIAVYIDTTHLKFRCAKFRTASSAGFEVLK